MMKTKFWLTMLLVAGIFKAQAQETITNAVGMEFIWVKPGVMTVGEFRPPYPVPADTVKATTHQYIMWMGDGRGYNQREFELARELAAQSSSKGFTVKIDKPYYLGQFEVTQGQWKKVMGTNPSTFKEGPDADSRPVENVTWDDAQQFIRALNKKENTKCYRLPTEFEWEYAARAGATNDIPWPEIETTANLNKTHTLAVGSKEANAWGFYDMLGNVWEWVQDYYNEKIFADESQSRSGTQHVLKGASFAGDVKNATFMTHAGGPGNGWDVGFRVLKVIDQK